MLLRGVKFSTPMLNDADVRAVKGRAQHSGRQFGGAPLNGRGRGGRMDYGGGRPNPFAAHLDPRFMNMPQGGQGGPQGGQQGGMPMMPPGWVPPQQGAGDYSRGPPPPPRGGMSHQYPPRDYNGQQGQYGGHQNYGSQDNYGRGGYRGGRGRGHYQGGNRGNRGGGGGGGGYGRY